MKLFVKNTVSPEGVVVPKKMSPTIECCFEYLIVEAEIGVFVKNALSPKGVVVPKKRPQPLDAVSSIQ